VISYEDYERAFSNLYEAADRVLRRWDATLGKLAASDIAAVADVGGLREAVELLRRERDTRPLAANPE
jgi:hypothetical protein